MLRDILMQCLGDIRIGWNSMKMVLQVLLRCRELFGPIRFKMVFLMLRGIWAHIL